MVNFNNTFSDDYNLENYNLKNNQNYIIDKKMKIDMLFDYINSQENFIFPSWIIFKWIFSFFKKHVVRIEIYDKFLFFIGINFIFMWIFFWFISIFSIEINFNIFIYAIFSLYFSFFITKIFIDYFSLKVYVLWFKKGKTLFEPSYKEKLVWFFKFKNN